jgi:putative Holliday junction resolvase
MIILGIDYGDSRTGVARVNMTCPIVTPIGTIKDKTIEGTAQKVAKLAQAENAEKVVLGLPRNMDGSEGPRAEKTRHFGELLAQLLDLEIIFSDERLSSSYAHNIMNFTDTRGKKRKESVDALAATIILQSYVDSLHR